MNVETAVGSTRIYRVAATESICRNLSSLKFQFDPDRKKKYVKEKSGKTRWNDISFVRSMEMGNEERGKKEERREKKERVSAFMNVNNVRGGTLFYTGFMRFESHLHKFDKHLVTNASALDRIRVAWVPSKRAERNRPLVTNFVFLGPFGNESSELSFFITTLALIVKRNNSRSQYRTWISHG